MWEAEGSGPDQESVKLAIDSIVNHVLTAAIATAADETPWIFTAYVAFKDNRCWFTSQGSTRHVAELRRSPVVGIAMWKPPEAWGDKLLGLQLQGHASEIGTPEAADEGLEVLHGKYLGTLGTLPNSDAVVGPSKRTCLFVAECQKGSLRDEARIGKGRFPIVWMTR